MKAGGCLSDHKLNIYCCSCVCRGEKLYVTKDKRQSQSWRRCICWGCGFVLLSVAILIAVLAGSEYTEVLFSWIIRVGDGWMSMEHRWNDTDVGTHNSSLKSLSIATIYATICTWTVLGLNPGFLMVRLAANSLTVETVYQTHKFYWQTDSWMNACSEQLCLSVKHSYFPFRRPKVKILPWTHIILPVFSFFPQSITAVIHICSDLLLP